MSTETAAPDQQEIFQQLEEYPWGNDTEFQGGLSAILGPATEPSQVHELTLRAQVFYLSRKKSIPIDFDAYKAYLTTKNPSCDPTPDNLPTTEPTTTSQSTEVARPTSSHLSTPESTAKPDTAPYPPSFAEIVALITSGALIPGIKDIPNTVDPSARTESKMAKRRKPWESADALMEPTEGTFGDRRDEYIVQEYPE